MTTPYYSPAKLVGAPGLPTTVQNINARAKRENWPRRRRSGQGGGWEYPITALPDEARLFLARQSTLVTTDDVVAEGTSLARRRRITQEVDQAVQKRVREQGLAAAAALNGKDAERMDNRLLILSAFNSFKRQSGLSKDRAMHRFTHDYADGSVDIDPEIKAAIPSFSARTLQRWMVRLNEEGAAGLGGHYQGRKGKSKIDSNPQMYQAVVGMLVEYPDVDTSDILDLLNTRFAAEEIPSERRLQLWIKGWKKDNAEVFLAHSNPDAWKNSYMMALGSKSEGIEALNQLWELDSTPADVMLRDGRHSIIGVIDVWSRRLKLHVSRTSKASAIAALARRAILDWGVPAIAKTDNGQDYKSKHLQRVFPSLGINQQFCPPFQPWHKPHIERAFGTFSDDLLKMLPGYLGHSVAEQQAIRSRKAFSERLFTKDAVIEIHMTRDELQAFCDRWVEDIYHHNRHSSLGMSPAAKVQSWTGTVLRVDDERALDLLLAEAPSNGGVRKVRKDAGILVDGYSYLAQEQGLHSGREVQVLYDETDISKVRVYALDLAEHLFDAVCPDLAGTGVTRAELAAQAKAIQKRKTDEGRKLLKDTAKKAAVADVVGEILAHRAATNPKVSTFPPPHETHSTPALEAAAIAARADRGQVGSGLSAEQQAGVDRQMEVLRQQQMAPVVTGDTPDGRYKRFLRLSSADQATLSDGDARWLKTYPTTSEYRVQKAIAESWQRQAQA
ncbi:MAG: hypothetical protein AUJ55_07095 [Proteobacteria bacterium CG1_02_64_396]|nr:MAG: hypothetical protein AUJ55_07095 [Proteobacteria bacterium CG1_02_64_396]